MNNGKLVLPEEWKPKYTNDLITKLKQAEMLRLCGEWVLDVYWNRLRRRIDMMAFTIIQRGQSGGDMRPAEQEPVTADMLFSALVEPDVKRGAQRYTTIWLADVLFRLMVLGLTEGLPEHQDEPFHYFTAPYFNCCPYDSLHFGEDWLDQLTEEVFRETLEEWILEIRETYFELLEGEHTCTMSWIYFRANRSL